MAVLDSELTFQLPFGLNRLEDRRVGLIERQTHAIHAGFLRRSLGGSVGRREIQEFPNTAGQWLPVDDSIGQGILVLRVK